MNALTSRWNDRIDSAGEDRAALSGLVRELVRARVAALSDMVAQRQATWAMVRVQHQLGETDKALHTAREWLQLADSPPVASDDEVAAVRAWIGAAGGSVPKQQRLPRADSRGRGRDKSSRGREASRPQRQASLAPLDAARQAGLAGKWGEAFKALRRARGPEAHNVRAWLHIAKALSLEGEARETQLRETEVWLRKRANIAPAEAKAPSSPPPADDPVAQILGRAVPKKRNAAVRAVESHIASQPDSADTLAATVLRQHVATEGPERAAPWWITAVTVALATSDGTATRAAIEELGQAASVQAYAEPLFESVVTAARAAAQAGNRITSVRRGASRDEPADRRLWTLRFKGADRNERQLALAPESESPWPEGLVDGLAARLLHLCPLTVLSASGAGNHQLVDACGRAGVIAVAGAPAAAIAALSALAAPEPSSAPAAGSASKKQDKPEPKPARPRPLDVLRQLLSDGAAQPELAEAMVAVRRRRTVQRAIEEAGLDDDAIANAAVAATLAWPGERPLPEITTLLVRQASSGGAAARALLTEGEHAARLGGPGIELLLDLVSPAVAAGWSVDRILRASTRRERENNPLVEAAGEGLRDLWRAVLQKGDSRGELWALTNLPPEGRAAIPQLLLDPRQRVVVVPLEPELLEWYGSTGGPEAIGWSGPEASDAVLSALDAWT